MQDLAALSLGRPHMAADVRQFRRGGVGDGVLVGDGPFQPLLQRPVPVEGQEQVVNGSVFPGFIVEILLGPPGGGEEPRNSQQFPGV